MNNAVEQLKVSCAGFIKQTHQSALFWGIAVVILKTGSAVLLLPLLLKRLSSAELGLWYVFLSIGGLAGLLDLGFSGCLVRSTGYLWAGAKRLLPMGHGSMEENGNEGPNIPVLASLVYTMRSFYLALAITILCLVGVAGTRFLYPRITPLTHSHEVWIAWGIFCVGLFMQTAGACWPSMLQGVNQVRKTQQIVMQSMLCGYLVSIVGLFAGYGLIAVTLGQYLVSGVLSRILCRQEFIKTLGREFAVPRKWPDLALLRVMWPMAWRAGIVGIGAYLIVSANTLIVASKLSLKDTAEYGLTMQVCNLLAGVAAMSFQVKLPMINQMRVLGDIHGIQALFITRIRWVILCYLAGSVGILSVGSGVLHLIGSHTHLLKSPLILVVLTMIFLEILHSQHAYLVFSENKNPFMWPALISGVAVLTLSYLLAPHYNLWGIIGSQFLVQLAFNNWWTVLCGIESIQLSFRQYVSMLVLTWKTVH